MTVTSPTDLRSTIEAMRREHFTRDDAHRHCSDCRESPRIDRSPFVRCALFNVSVPAHGSCKRWRKRLP